MIKRLFPVLSLTWVGCLLLGFHLSGIFKPPAAQSPIQDRTSGQPITLQNKPVAQPVNPVPKSNPVAANTTTEAIDPTINPDRLEIQLSRRKVTLYWNHSPISSYPIAVGRQGWETPTGQFRVVQMRENPKWINPLTNQKIAAGDPENPLGSYWIGFWTDGKNWIGLHGTPDRASVGKATSHGCIRMYDEDIGELYALVNQGTQVIVKP